MRRNPNRESYQHKKMIVDYLEELSKQGWKTINLRGKSPDGIAVKDNKIVAVEILIKGKDGKSRITKNNKYDSYSMFDDIFIKSFDRDENFEKKRIEEEDHMFKTLMKIKEEDKINKEWNKYGV